MRSILLLAALALPPQFTNVVVVDTVAGPGVDFTDVFLAVDGSPDGTVVLVRPGSYSGFTAIGKSIAVVADNGGPVVLQSASVVGTGGAQRVLVDGVDFAPTGLAASGISVQGECDVWIEDVEVVGSVSLLNNHGVFVTDARVVQLVGAHVPTIPAPTWGDNAGFTALRVLGTQLVSVWDSSLASQHGGYGSTAAYAGADLAADQNFASGSTFQGNDGSPAIFDSRIPSGGACIPAGQPGSAIASSNQSVLVDCVLLPGQPGPSADGICPGGTVPADAIQGEASTLATLGGRTFDVTGVVRPGDPAQMAFGGVPGELAVIGVATAPDFSVESSLSGVLSVGLAPTLVTLGTLDGSGSLVVPFTSSLPPGTAQLLYAQALFVGSADGAVPGTPRTTLLLGAGF